MATLESANLRLYRFSTRQRICDLAHEGLLYLNPATQFGEKGLSKGAFDPEELSLSQTIPPGTTLEVLSRKTGEWKELEEPINFGQLTAESDTNYYVFCMTYQYTHRFYTEFNADTCLVITNPDRFINQAGKCLRKELPGWLVNAGTVRYRSKKAFYSLYPSYRDIFYNKDAEEFMHQYEVRIVCAPPKRILDLEAKVIRIGNLYGYTFITGIEDPKRMIESEYSNALGSPFKCGK
jgi:hypothetical protein